MTEEQKEKYANFLDKISEILGLNKPVDILRLCAVTDEYLRPREKRIAELEKQSKTKKQQLIKAKEIIEKLLNAFASNDFFEEEELDAMAEAEQFLKEDK